jgi:flavodoxin
MKYLRKTLWVIGLVILLELLKKLLGYTFNDAIVFYHNLLISVQVILLLWLIITLIAESVISKKGSSRKTGRNVLLILLCVITVSEITCTWFLHYPSKIPRLLLPAFRHYYDRMQRNIIQFNPACTVYDSSLFYTLKPSSKFVFDNYEFSDSFFTNKMGLRDDSASLNKPEVICLGDSYAMGWGVGQQETFAEQLSILSGKEVLNAAIASYATVRELKNLYRLDTSSLQYIVIQYCGNDFQENEEFVKQNYSLKLSPEKVYTSSVDQHYWSKFYFPGKHCIISGKIAVREKIADLRGMTSKQSIDSYNSQLKQAASNFVNILFHSAINFSKCKVYVVDLNQRASMNNSFLNAVQILADSSLYQGHFNNHLTVVPTADLFTRNDYYILDDHLRASGHRKIAERLMQYMFPGN